jgi:serine/threonine protein kinase
MVNQQPAAMKMIEVGAAVGRLPVGLALMHPCVLCACAVQMPGIASTFQSTMRVVEEAKHLMLLKHPNVVQCFDVFGHQAVIDEQRRNFVCILMELCTLGSLADHVYDCHLSCSALVDCVRQICAGLAHAHSLGIYHCDLKLENILLQRDPEHPERCLVKLGDWGVAKREALALGAALPGSAKPHDGPRLDPTGRAAFREAGDPAAPYPASRPACAEENPKALPAYTADRLVPSDRALMMASKATVGPCTTAYGTLCYQAPECHEPGRQRMGFHWAQDMWSLGCVMYEAGTQQCLPLGTSEEVLGRQALRPSREWEAVKRQYLVRFGTALLAVEAPDHDGKNIKAQLTVLLSALWSVDVQQRPAAAEVCEALPAHHRWLL